MELSFIKSVNSFMVHAFGEIDDELFPSNDDVKFFIKKLEDSIPNFNDLPYQLRTGLIATCAYFGLKTTLEWFDMKHKIT